ncbi:MAG: hypothetical protein ACYCXW_10325 [Solirubrobacteraceae bacterium]
MANPTLRLANTRTAATPELTGVPERSPVGALGRSRLAITIFGGEALFGAVVEDGLAV